MDSKPVVYKEPKKYNTYMDIKNPAFQQGQFDDASQHSLNRRQNDSPADHQAMYMDLSPAERPQYQSLQRRNVTQDSSTQGKSLLIYTDRNRTKQTNKQRQTNITGSLSTLCHANYGY